MKRCSWCNLKNPIYVKYHDAEWGVPNFDERYLFEMLILESFQAGLSWECVLNKREAFRRAYENFDINKVADYDEAKIAELMENKEIIRNGRKIRASITNARIFKELQNEYGSFYNYLLTFIRDSSLSSVDSANLHLLKNDIHLKEPILREVGPTTNPWSDAISKDLKKRGMKFIGSTIIYSYLQAVGFIDSHDADCDLPRSAPAPARSTTR